MNPPSWSQVPPPPSPPARRWVPPSILVIVAIASPAALAGRSSLVAAGVVAAAGAIALAVVAASRPPWPVRAAVAIAAAAVVALAVGAGPAWWLLAGLVLGWWLVAGLPPIDALPGPGPGVRVPAAVLGTLSTAMLLVGRHPARAVIVYAALAALPLLSLIGGGAVLRAIDRVGSAVGGVVATVGFGLLGIVVVILPWLVQRLLRIDPLAPRAGWSLRRRRSAQPASPWSTDSLLDAPPAGPRLRAAGAAVVAVSVAALTIPSSRSALIAIVHPPEPERHGFEIQPSDEDADLSVLREPVPPGVKATPHIPGTPFAAHAHDPWFTGQTYSSAGRWGFDPQGAWRTVDVHRVRDFTSRWINVLGGHRRTWQPPPCTCRRLSVWVYGGSTTFGLDQRDDHTIPSELARVAAEHGITLDVSNRGLPGFLQWMEAEHLAWDLSQEDPPDLVVMYDGVNDVWATAGVNATTGDTKAMRDPTSADIWTSTRRSDPPAPPGPPGSGYAPPTVATISGAAYARLVIKRYEESADLSRMVAAEHGLPIRYFWQPTRLSRPLVLSEPHLDTEGENYSRLDQQILTDLMPDDITTMEDTFDGTDAPLFVDDVHHNELGARLVAEKLYAELAPQLRRLLED